MPASKLLIVSNGHGEDAIAAEIARKLPTSIEIAAYPMLGDGSAYQGGCAIVGPRAYLPSEGWRNVRNSIARDIRGGGLAMVPPALSFLRAARDAYSRVLVVGDMTGVYGCFLTGYRSITYLDVYKTGFGGSYLGIDKWMLRRVAKTAFCRASSLADSLKSAGIDARAPGNVMMDTIPRTGLTLPRTRPLGLTILPGSRDHSIANFALQAASLSKVPPDLMPDVFLAVARSIDPDRLAAAAGLTHESGHLRGGPLDIVLVPGSAMGDALDASDLVLSQAGTATVQALGLGQPAITFQTAADRPSRFEAESRLFGEARQVVADTPAAIADKLIVLLSDGDERRRLAAIGRERIGPPGAINEIIAELTR